MRQRRSMVLFVIGCFSFGQIGYAGDSMRAYPEPLAMSQLAQTPQETAQPPSVAAQESNTMPPSASTDLPSAPEPGETQGETPSGEVQERGLPIKPGLRTPFPSKVAPPEGFVGATDNITKVGRAVQVRSKSLTTFVVVASGVVVTQPVTISIALGGYGPTRQTQTYIAYSGNHFLHNDPEGDGKPRRAFADITLSEPKPGGGIYTSTIPGSVMLDPLFDVTVSPLSVKLIDDCDPYGDSDMYVDWYSPDDQYHHKYFKTRARNPATTINEFAWARAEVGAFANLHVPTYFLSELDDVESIDPNYKGPGHSNVNLVPGGTKDFVAKVQVLTRGKQCRANTQYTITYKVHWYQFL